MTSLIFQFCGSSSLYANRSILSVILNGPAYCPPNFFRTAAWGTM